MRFGAAFDLQRVHAHLHQTLDMLHGAQVLGVHDVGAVLVLVGGHVFAGTGAVFQQKHLIGRRTDAQGWLYPVRRDPVRPDLLHWNRLVLMDYIADFVFLGFEGLVFPAAGIGAGALIGVAFVDVAR